MSYWIRFEHAGAVHFGTLDGEQISVYHGDMFDQPTATGEQLALSDVRLLTPCEPSKMLALWNNFHAALEKNKLPRPQHPWYFAKTRNSFAAAGDVIIKPAICSGKILFEGELGVVIGKPCKDVAVEHVDDYIFGYTCINDVTALEYLFNEDAFAHWIRAKNFDGFGVFGPTIATGVDPDSLSVKTLLVGDETQERQNYPVSDMIFSPREIVSKISFDMSLNPGDIIACGTSLGAGALKDGWDVEVVIDGVGRLVNRFQDH